MDTAPALLLSILALIFAGCGVAPLDGLSGSGGSGGSPSTASGPFPCSDGQARECHFQLPTQGSVINCFIGVETCNGGAWGPCSNGDVTSKRLIEPTPDKHAVRGEQPVNRPLDFVNKDCNDPCSPTCVKLEETPEVLGAKLDGQPFPPWTPGSFSSILKVLFPGPPAGVIPAGGANAISYTEPCTAAAQCQYNQYCNFPVTKGSVHDKCAPGVGLANTGGADVCVDKICALDPTCCVAVGGGCGHSLCTPGAGVLPLCDACVTVGFCAANPICCLPGANNWDASCIAAAKASCALPCNAWSQACVDRVHDVCGGHCTAAPNAGPPPMCEHDKCYSGGPISNTCSDACVGTICANPAFAYCCNDAWDAKCIEQVSVLCSEACPVKGKCVPWLGGQTDPLCDHLPDLTLGVPCGTSVPVCNVGTADAVGPIAVQIAPGASGKITNCGPHGSAKDCVPVPGPIAPGQCIVADCSGVIPAPVAGDEIIVNGDGAVTECVSTPTKGSCFDGINSNNWSMIGTGAPDCETAICTGSPVGLQVKPLNLLIAAERSAATNANWTNIRTGIASFLAGAPVAGKVALMVFPDGPVLAGYGSPFVGAIAPLLTCDTTTCTATPPTYGPSANCAPRNGCGQQNLPQVAGSTMYKTINTMPASMNAAPYPMAFDEAITVAKTFASDKNIALILGGSGASCGATIASLAGQAAAAFAPPNNIKTWVINYGAVAGSYDAIAAAGGTKQEQLVATDVQLKDALDTIRTGYYTCEYPLPDQALFDKTGPEVKLNNFGVITDYTQVASPDPGKHCTGAINEFYYDSDASPTKIVLCDNTCTDVRSKVNSAIKIYLECPGTFDDSTFSAFYEGKCGPGQKVQWGFLTYDSVEPLETSVEFFTRTDNDLANLMLPPPPGGGPAYHTLMNGGVPVVATLGPPDTQVCRLDAAPKPLCAVDLFANLGGLPEAQYDFIELMMNRHTNISHSQTPLMKNWWITYSCLDLE